MSGFGRGGESGFSWGLAEVLNMYIGFAVLQPRGQGTASLSWIGKKGETGVNRARFRSF